MVLFLPILLIILFLKIESKDKLIFVMTHFRHGARAPQIYYNKTDGSDYIKEKWDNPGELTGIGQRMHFYLGLRNRLRYIEDNQFLSKQFNPHELLIYSSCLNRTIVSVSSQLQGLYPPHINIGENIKSEQEECTKPPVKLNLNDERISEDIKNSLKSNALPNSMTIAPIRMINSNEKKIRLYDTGPCKIKAEEIMKNNSLNLQSLKDIVKEFKDKYGEKFDNFYKKKENYDVAFIENVCDAFLSAYPEKKEMKEFKTTGIEKEEFKHFCDNFQILDFRDWVLGDKNHSIAHLESSNLMKEFIHYMKERIELDKKGEIDNFEKKYDDYSKPKMMMISGHDTTVSCFEIFLMEALGYNSDFYRYPDFAAQIAFEVTTKEDNKTGKTDKDYYVNYYFNDDLLFSITVEDFITKINKHIWSEQNINEFCGFEEEKDKQKDKPDDNPNNNEKYNENNTLMKIALIVFISLTGIFLIIIIILSIQLIRNKKSESRIYNSLVPDPDV